MKGKILDYDGVQKLVNKISGKRMKRGDILGKLDNLDVLEVFHELGIPYHRFVSGGNLNTECRRGLREIGDEVFGHGTLRGNHFEYLAESPNVKELLDMMTIVDLCEIQRYGFQQ